MTIASPAGNAKYSRKFASDVLTSVLGTAGGQLVNILAIPVLARIYRPDEFGVWALFLATVAIISVIATLRFDLAVVAAKTTKMAESILLLTVVFAVLLSAGLETLLLLGASLYGNGSGPAWLLRNLGWLEWTPLGIGATAIYTVLTGWWLRNGAYRRITSARIGLPATSVALQIVLRNLPHGIGLVAGNCIAQLLAALAVGFFVLQEIRGSLLAKRSYLRSYAIVRKFHGFALYTMPYSLQGQFFRQIILFILASFVSTATSGLYAMAQRIVYNPLALIAAALEQATFPRLARTPDDPAIHRLIARVMFWLACVLGVGCAFVTVFATPLVTIVLGQKWIPSTPYIVALSYASASLVASSWIARVFDLFGRQRLHLAIDLSANILTLAVFLVVLLVAHSALWGVVALSAGQALYYMLWTILAFRISRMDARPLLRIALASVSAWAASYALFFLAHELLRS